MENSRYYKLVQLPFPFSSPVLPRPALPACVHIHSAVLASRRLKFGVCVCARVYCARPRAVVELTAVAWRGGRATTHGPPDFVCSVCRFPLCAIPI